jgi:ParB-like partition proteins
MSSLIKTSFDLRPIKVPLNRLRETAPRHGHRDLRSFQSVLASIKEVGILQPIVVCPAHEHGVYKILDGHLRYYALKELSIEKIDCIVSLDDERYTFGAQINYLNPIQRAKMITKAVKNGLSPERIAKALDLDPKKIITQMNIMEGLDDRVKELLKTTPVSSGVLNSLKKVREIRQIQIADAMVMNNNFSINYVRGMVLATPKSLFRETKNAQPKRYMHSGMLESMGYERSNVQVKVKEIMPIYNKNVFELTTIIAFLRKILNDPILVGYLSKHFSDIHNEFVKIAETSKLE